MLDSFFHSMIFRIFAKQNRSLRGRSLSDLFSNWLFANRPEQLLPVRVFSFKAMNKYLCKLCFDGPIFRLSDMLGNNLIDSLNSQIINKIDGRVINMPCQPFIGGIIDLISFPLGFSEEEINSVEQLYCDINEMIIKNDYIYLIISRNFNY